MDKENQVLATMNPFGYVINENDVDRILNPNTSIDKVEREHVSHFFKVPAEKLSKELLMSYAKANKVMTNVSIGSYHEYIRTKLIDTIAGAKRCFCYGEYLATIELCALHGEMLANFLCIVHEDELKESTVIDNLKGKSKGSVAQCLADDNFYDALNQKHRIEWLAAGQIINLQNKQDLIDIHELRKKYFHHWDQSHDNIESDALIALEIISRVASRYVELLNQNDNIEKTRKYINSHFDN